LAAGLRPDSLGELKRSPRPPSREKGRGRGRGGQGVGERGEGKGYGTGKDKGVRGGCRGMEKGREGRGKGKGGETTCLTFPSLASASNTTLPKGTVRC